MTTDERLRGAGVRATRPRRLVLEALEALGGHRSADDVLAAVRAAGGALSRQTVYSSLDRLVVAGLAAEAEVGAGSARFEAVVAAGPHQHFVCRVCGAVLDVEGAAPALVPPPGAVVESSSVLLRGVCADCGAR